MEMFLALVVAGAVHGCAYGLVGLAFMIIYNGTSIINVAQGEFVMVAAVMASYGSTKWVLATPLFWAISIGVVLLLALVFHWVFTRPLLGKRAELLAIVIVTLSGSMLITGATGIFTNYSPLYLHPLLSISAWKLGALSISPQYVLVIGVAALVVALYWLFERKTVIGLALRATGLNRDMAQLLGVSTGAMAFLAFVISGFVSGVTALVYVPLINVSALIGAELLLNGFVAAVIGGMGNPYAALVGGMVVGVAGSLAAGYVAPGFAALVTFFLLIIILIFRPYGLFGVRHG